MTIILDAPALPATAKKRGKSSALASGIRA
jgi:hypothetical protein